MPDDYYTKLTITLEQSGGQDLSSPNATKSTLETDMVDCNVHAWFRIFEQVLREAGFSEELIAIGGCELAFNEMRPIELMRKVAKAYDLQLLEDVSDCATKETTPNPLTIQIPGGPQL